MAQLLLFFDLADHTALLWSIEAGKCLVKYTGHVGSGELYHVICILTGGVLSWLTGQLGR